MEFIVRFIQNIYLSVVFVFYLIKYTIFRNEKPTIEYLEIEVGTKCTLKCKYCAPLIPYFKEKVSYDIDEVINDIEIMLKVVNFDNLDISGGEPLTHPKLYKLLEYILDKDDIKNVQLFTNLTIIPTGKTLESILKLRDKKNFLIRGSEYIGQESKQEKTLKFLKQNNIKLFLPFNDKDKTWAKVVLPGQKKTNLIKQFYYFKVIPCNFCPTVDNGIFLYCPRGVGVSKVFNVKYGFFDVTKIREISHIPTLKASIKVSLNRHCLKTFCQYCFRHGKKILPGADQLD